MSDDDKLLLEQLLDRTSAMDLCDALAEICHAKAEHIQTNWQGGVLAFHWDKLGERFEKAADSFAARVISGGGTTAKVRS